MKETKSENATTARVGDTLFLPNFCDIRMVFAIVLIAELLAFVLTLTSSAPGRRWGDLSLLSLFIQWIALTSTALLCVTRPLLCRLGNISAGLSSYALLLVVAWAVSILAAWVLGTVPAGDTPDDLVLRTMGISAIVGAVILRYFYVQHQWRRQIERESQARIQALHSRIRPHFLFNSMNVIASLTRTNPKLAEEVVQDLADLFRFTLSNAGARISLQDELEVSRRYLHIEQQRLGERLDVQWHMDGIPSDASIPPLTVQPLLENAVYHGIEPQPGGGTIEVSGARRGSSIEISIQNPLPAEGNPKHRKGNQLAMDNIRERLEAVYGRRGGLRTESTDGRFVATITIPYMVEGT